MKLIFSIKSWFVVLYWFDNIEISLVSWRVKASPWLDIKSPSFLLFTIFYSGLKYLNLECLFNPGTLQPYFHSVLRRILSRIRCKLYLINGNVVTLVPIRSYRVGRFGTMPTPTWILRCIIISVNVVHVCPWPYYQIRHCTFQSSQSIRIKLWISNLPRFSYKYKWVQCI